MAGSGTQTAVNCGSSVTKLLHGPVVPLCHMLCVHSYTGECLGYFYFLSSNSVMDVGVQLSVKSLILFYIFKNFQEFD